MNTVFWIHLLPGATQYAACLLRDILARRLRNNQTKLPAPRNF